MEKTEFIRKFNEKLKEYLGFEANIEQASMFYDYMDMLIETNKVMNLTAITDPDEIIVRHFVDSLFLMKLDCFKNGPKIGFSVVDVGTGAGFPGLPLAIMNPKVDFLLLDSLQKRIKFLNEVIANIGIKNVVVSHMRAEDVKMGTVYRENYFLAISRGVTKISTLSEYLLPYVKKSGKMIAYKMSDCEKEFEEGKNAIKILGGKFVEKFEYELIKGEPKRCFLVFEKIKNTDKKFPRQGNKPKTEPL